MLTPQVMLYFSELRTAIAKVSQSKIQNLKPKIVFSSLVFPDRLLSLRHQAKSLKQINRGGMNPYLLTGMTELGISHDNASVLA